MQDTINNAIYQRLVSFVVSIPPPPLWEGLQFIIPLSILSDQKSLLFFSNNQTVALSFITLDFHISCSFSTLLYKHILNKTFLNKHWRVILSQKFVLYK